MDLLSTDVISLALFLAFVIPCVFFLVTQQRTLDVIRPENRTIPGGRVWLQLIPLFGFYYQFYVVKAISYSLKNEFSDYASMGETGLPHEDVVQLLGKRPLLELGYSYCGMEIVYVLFNSFANTERNEFLVIIGLLLALAMTIVWIVYWVRLVQFRKKVNHLRDTLSII